MADIGTTLKDAFARGMEAIGSAASSIASSTRQKVDEINLSARRTELLNGFGAKAFAAWQDGAVLPEELTGDLQEIAEIDAQLARLRAERAAAQTEDPAQPATVTKGEMKAPAMDFSVTIAEAEAEARRAVEQAAPAIRAEETVVVEETEKE